eukprot:864675-Rhodomonas_salina.1
MIPRFFLPVTISEDRRQKQDSTQPHQRLGMWVLPPAPSLCPSALLPLWSRGRERGRGLGRRWGGACVCLAVGYGCGS